ncbi:ribonuclease III [Anaerocellum danielii]|uniref:ribonuclease III n=1 Tax=Anaerocellum danielii TaxID=1387557 RepID=UPI0005EBDF36|nr:ribonuclease III [Caldicellulosiruptor danielii]
MEEIEKALGYKFKDKSLMRLALTHKSATHSNNNCYERLEFLGDAALELAVSKYLFVYFPELSEGELTSIRTAVVCSQTLSKVAEKLNLKNHIIFGKREKMEKFQENKSILADVLEALFGAIFIESGFDIVEKIIVNLLKPYIQKAVEGKLFYDYKTKLQELVQKRGHKKIVYKDCEIIEKKYFKSELFIEGKKVSEGYGTSKKEAQQDAAYKFLLEMGEQEE